MTNQVREIGGMRAFVVSPEGPPIAAESDALDLIGEGFPHRADLMVIPAQRLSPEFFRLASGLAGAVLQKLVNYRYRVAIVGDVQAQVAASTALRDFVRESNRGRHVWFTPDMEALEASLAGRT